MGLATSQSEDANVSHHPSSNTAITCLPVAILGLLTLMTVMYFGATSSGFY